MKRIAFAAVVAATATAPHAQSYGDLRNQLDMQWRETTQNLRRAMVQKRDQSRYLCARGISIECELAALEEAEILLLDIEVKYRYASSPKAQEVKEAADTARHKVSDLQDRLEELNKQ